MLEILKHPDRVLKEAELISMRFGEIDFEDDWILINRFDMPPGFNRDTSRMLIDLPLNFPEVPPNRFYIDQGVRLTDGSKPRHYFEKDYVSKELRGMGFAWYCVHIKKWKPNFNDMFAGSTLLKAIDACYQAIASEVR